MQVLAMAMIHGLRHRNIELTSAVVFVGKWVGPRPGTEIDARGTLAAGPRKAMLNRVIKASSSRCAAHAAAHRGFERLRLWPVRPPLFE
jgi:hypothetical protein